MVLNRIPFMVAGAASTELINDNTAEVFAELQVVLAKSDAEYLDEDNYLPKETSLIADMVGVQILYRRIISNMEGVAGAAATGNKILTKAKAGEAEAEFSLPKGGDGSTLLMTANQVMGKLMDDAMRKARNLGWMLDISKEATFTIYSMSQPTQQFTNIPYYDE